MFQLLSRYYKTTLNGNFDAEEAKKAGWDEFAGILNLKTYWLSYVLIALLISFTGSYDTSYIESVSVRTTFTVSFLLVSGLGCAVLASIYRMITGRSSFKNFDIVVKCGILWVLIAAFPARFMISYLGDVPLTAAQVMQTGVHGFSIALSVTVIMYIWARRKSAARQKLKETQAAEAKFESIQTSDPIQAFEGQMPYYIESEDHYLKMVYLGNVEFIRANLCEVAAGFAARGMRCHKSYWVSRSAIERRRRQGRQLLLVLKDGTEIPVGRSFEKRVRASLDTEMAFG